MNRTQILETARDLISGDREDTYGPPLKRWEILAGLWNEYLRGRGCPAFLNPYDVGVMMALDKISRIAVSPFHGDNYVDACGYLANAGEVALEGEVIPDIIPDIIPDAPQDDAITVHEVEEPDGR